MADTASTIVSNLLTEYGLTFSQRQVNQWVGLLADDPGNIVIIEEEIRQSPQWEQRFPGMQARIDNGYDPITPAEYIEAEAEYLTIIRNSGLPPHFYDEPHELAELISNNVAPAEFETRVVRGFLAAQQAPQEVKDALREFYNIGDTDGALAAYYLDPDRGLEAVQRQFESAQIAGRAAQRGYLGLTQEQAERLQALGVDDQQAFSGFGKIEEDRELTSGNLGRGEISDEEILAAQFEGDVDSIRKIENLRRSRINTFQGGSGAAITQEGVLGLRSTSG